jgi:phosphoglycolate phosphatase
MPAPVAVFDLDGTLVDTAPDLLATLNVVLTASGYQPMPAEKTYGAIGQGSRVMIERALEYQDINVDDATLQRMHEHYLDHYVENIAVSSRPFDGVVDLLDRLSGEGVRLAVCTNKLEGLSVRLLTELGLADRFAAIVGADTLDVRKPDPGHVLGTIERAGGDKTRAIMVGDSRADIDAAKAAGVPVIAVDFGYTETPVRELGPDHIISHYDALYELAAPVLGLSRG